MNILCIGDIVGKPGRAALEGHLENIKGMRLTTNLVNDLRDAAQ